MSAEHATAHNDHGTSHEEAHDEHHAPTSANDNAHADHTHVPAAANDNARADHAHAPAAANDNAHAAKGNGHGHEAVHHHEVQPLSVRQGVWKAVKEALSGAGKALKGVSEIATGIAKMLLSAAGFGPSEEVTTIPATTKAATDTKVTTNVTAEPAHAH